MKYSHNPYSTNKSKKIINGAINNTDDIGEFASPSNSPDLMNKGGKGSITIHAKTHHKNKTMAGPDLQKHDGTLLP